ncbi:hypothetical protein COCON_G00004060 [Conger conger]|uniref:Uncharacterized protein n=1 Tax=Conger conger TaxID=82655 RepID=A0A9Q1E162_CONCO|nr:hypothetical protein COCON_G00004060 [Conger conger]
MLTAPSPGPAPRNKGPRQPPAACRTPETTPFPSAPNGTLLHESKAPNPDAVLRRSDPMDRLPTPHCHSGPLHLHRAPCSPRQPPPAPPLAPPDTGPRFLLQAFDVNGVRD